MDFHGPRDGLHSPWLLLPQEGEVTTPENLSNQTLK